jgi:hypothetical protein
MRWVRPPKTKNRGRGAFVEARVKTASGQRLKYGRRQTVKFERF